MGQNFRKRLRLGFFEASRGTETIRFLALARVVFARVLTA